MPLLIGLLFMHKEPTPARLVYLRDHREAKVISIINFTVDESGFLKGKRDICVWEILFLLLVLGAQAHARSNFAAVESRTATRDDWLESQKHCLETQS